MDSSKKEGMLPYHSEGMKNGEWVIVDFVDVVAHIFYREKRDFYMLEELWSDAKITKHDPEAAIKPKVVRQSKRKYAAVSDDTLEDIEKSLPLSDRAPAKREFSGGAFAKRKAEVSAAKRALRTDERRAAGKTSPDEKPRDKKFVGKKLADKKFVDKKIQERKSASKKSSASGEAKSMPGKTSGTKAPASKKAAAPKKTITKRK
jgi:hypothetical protein